MARPSTDVVRDAYDANVERYTAFACGDLDRVPCDRERLATFASLATHRRGAVADLGCGPGHIAAHLSELGLAVVGRDISPGMVGRARRTFPDLRFEVGDLAASDIADSALGGIVARYSLIHVPPERLRSIFGQWCRVLEPDAPVLVSFFAAPVAEDHGLRFDHAVVTAYELFPGMIVGELEDAGFVRIEVATRAPLDGERPLDHATILARRPA